RRSVNRSLDARREALSAHEELHGASRERNRNVANAPAPPLVASTPHQEVRMQIHPTSFLLGLGAALVVPLFTRVLRPLAVEAAVAGMGIREEGRRVPAAAGMGIVEEGRRLAAEQMEPFEDIVAEARARREEQLLAEANGHHVEAAAEVERAGDEADRAGAGRRGR